MSHAAHVVFVVDDDVSVREALELLIDSAGWQAETFASAQESPARPRVVAPRCLVLDITLPGLNGINLQKRTAADRSDMPIIFITGHGDVPMTAQAMKAGAVEFLTKPFSDDAMLSAIQNAIERSLSSKRSTRQKVAGSESAYLSVAPSSRVIMAAFGLRRMTVREPHFHFPFLSIPLAGRTFTVLARFGQLRRRIRSALQRIYEDQTCVSIGG